jgi:acetyltransferase EpsM
MPEGAHPSRQRLGPPRASSDALAAKDVFAAEYISHLIPDRPMQLLLIGGGGHALVVAEAARAAGIAAIGCIAPSVRAGLRHVGTDADLDAGTYADVPAIIAIGALAVRQQLTLRWPQRAWTQVIHPSAIISPSASIGRGAFIGPRAVVHSGAAIGDHAIINTGAIVEHDGRIGMGAHVAPGAVLGGGVSIGAWAHVGLNAAVREGLAIGDHAIVGMGATVIRPVPAGERWAGVPARPLKDR